MKIDIVKELLEKHSDEEIISYLYKVMNGIAQNYQTAMKANQSEVLWGNLGDMVMVTAILKAMKVRNDNRSAQAENMVK